MGAAGGVGLFWERSCEKASVGEEEAVTPPSAYLLTIGPTLLVDLVYLVLDTKKPSVKLIA